MFEQIHSHKLHFSRNFTNQNMQITDYLQEDMETLLEMFPHSKGEPDSLYESDIPFNGEFCINGTVDYFMGYSIPPNAQEQLYYIESFCVLHSESSYFTRRQRLNSYLLLYTYSGQGILEYNHKTYILKKGDGFLINCRLPHHYYADKGPWEHADLHFSGPSASMLLEIINGNENVTFRQPIAGLFQTQLEHLIKIYTEIIPYRELQVSVQLQSLIITALTSSEQYLKELNSIPQNIKYLAEYMKQNYNKPLSLDYLASFSGFSKYYMIRIFKKYLGYSPNEYLVQLRMDAARNLLTETNLPASKIALMVGIESESYFNRAFKKRYGTSPGQYRQLHRFPISNQS